MCVCVWGPVDRTLGSGGKGLLWPESTNLLYWWFPFYGQIYFSSVLGNSLPRKINPIAKER